MSSTFTGLETSNYTTWISLTQWTFPPPTHLNSKHSNNFSFSCSFMCRQHLSKQWFLSCLCDGIWSSEVCFISLKQNTTPLRGRSIFLPFITLLFYKQVVFVLNRIGSVQKKHLSLWERSLRSLYMWSDENPGVFTPMRRCAVSTFNLQTLPPRAASQWCWCFWPHHVCANRQDC